MARVEPSVGRMQGLLCVRAPMRGKLPPVAMIRYIVPFLTVSSLWAFAPDPARAAAPSDGDESAEQLGSASTPTEGGWIKQHGPRRNEWQLGVAGGVFLPSRQVDLAADGATFRHFERVAGALLVSGGYYPLRWLGVEVEGAVMPGGRVVQADAAATFWTVRGQLIAQLPFWRVVPYAVIGGGAIGVASDAAAVGNDTDGMWSWGGGVKLHLTRLIGLKLQVRTNLSQKFDARDFADSEDITVGVVFRFGGKSKAKPADRDADGFSDATDACPDDPGVEPDGCPPDRDNDGVVDATDQCPDNPGPAPTGCPDLDGDGFVGDDDACPDEAGVAPDGCPAPDSDGDGIADDTDKCVDEPETVNKYLDDDGCPDEVPKDVQTFAGVIEGIYFDTNKAKVKETSRPKLDKAVELLDKYPTMRIEISGHTDDRGSDRHNSDLSRRRAEAVRDYLVDKGVNTDRLEIRAVGSSEPLGPNDSEDGRAKNRRIEFEVLTQ